MTKTTLAGIGIAALSITSGNQARRHQRQNALQGCGLPSPKRQKIEIPPLTPIQDSDMYHDEAAKLAASISSYRYGQPMPGYMT